MEPTSSQLHHRNGATYPTQPYGPGPSNNLLPSVKSNSKSQDQQFAGFYTSCIENGKIYSLEVSQQPVRARMCGFGDKDRRPITPPPCIRLVVQDAATEEEIDISEIDTSFFVLTVDLWSADGKREVNLVRHSATSPSISAATSSSYPPPPQIGPIPMPYQPAYHAAPSPMPMAAGYGHPMMMHQPVHHPNAYHPHPGYLPSQYQHQQSYQHPPGHLPPPPMAAQAPAYYHPPTSAPVTPTHFYAPPMGSNQGPLLSPRDLPAPVIDPRASPGGMFTRNLIGSLCVSAFKLTCPANKLGVWFILQDLSVRTEGTFRLKMNFVNVGSPTSSQSLNNGTAPVLASIFSESFTVYSAKKFPGVIESTELSKCFALQGIKIPIRKDGARGNVRGEKEEDDEGDS